MKVLIGLLIERLGAFFAKIVGLMSKKAAVVALLAAMAIMVVSFTAALNGILSNLTTGVNQPLIVFGLSLLPSNTPDVIGFIGAARAAQWLFVWQMSVARSAFDAK
ncbi:hypothetical protein [Aeromonas enteropelogenes]|uniref:hypothetical protein n=1 Tax=Aeromonas enteropelogenes TaxID=29489 RepID=UPI000F51B1EE|nr:hypothetical protein [Aeromonas enteropelogenes]RQM71372.1 hypothetical protein EHZ64_00140 [Aeromonas enteropelogenes]